jgi:glycosyltransferase involved in cell wall biosynthesis
MEPDLAARVDARLAQSDLRDRVIRIDDLPHDAFLNALGRSRVYLRTHVSDGVCSSVMESLALGVPVVASENGTRPPGVITYPADDPAALADKLADALTRRDEIAAALPRPEVNDTLAREAALLTS